MMVGCHARTEKERYEGEKVTDHLTLYLVKENRLDSLDCDQFYYPGRAQPYRSALLLSGGRVYPVTRG